MSIYSLPSGGFGAINVGMKCPPCTLWTIILMSGNAILLIISPVLPGFEN